MLENFTNEDIADDLLDTGYLYLDSRIIERVAATPVRYPYVLRGGGEPASRYRTLADLLQNEAITFDDIRASWRYHGVLLGSPKFAEKLVHDDVCSCCLCAPDEPENPEQAEIAKPHSFIEWCRQVVASSNRYVILDTETTGLHGEIIDLAIIDTKGCELYNSLLRPLCAIEKKAMDTHHITEAMVSTAPTIKEEWERICDIVHGRTVITYNAEFDSARIAFSLKRYGLNTCSACQWTYECAMLKYAEFYNAPPKYGDGPGWQSLSNATRQQGIRLDPKAMHRALADAQATLALLCKVAATGMNSPTYLSS
jgi:DNA polymerase-3 subunit epsilon